MSSVLLGQVPEQDWHTMPVDELIPFIVQRFHERHRVQLPELIRLARRVEHVHSDSPDCPAGLADILQDLQQQLESHMLKEEQVLFPMLMRGETTGVQAPISVMRFEHDEHDRALANIASITNDITTPVGACNTWRGLYGALEQFTDDLIKHIDIENNVLFLNASNAAEGAHHG